MKNFIPKGLTRFGSRSVLKARKSSPTILVVAGTIGLVATAVVAVKASRKGEAVVQTHKEERNNIGAIPNKRGTATKQERKDVQVQVIELYYNTGLELTKVYGPTLALGAISVGSILYGHKILQGRHAATVAAYSGLLEQFTSYRGRVSKTLGEKAERDIFNGAHGERVEDPEHPGEYKTVPVFGEDPSAAVTRPWFKEGNPYCKKDPETNMMWLNATQTHMNQLFQIRGHLFLNEVNDALYLPRSAEGQVLGWVLGANHGGDDFIDFGHTTNDDPSTVAFRRGETNEVRLCFNVDGIVHDLI